MLPEPEDLEKYVEELQGYLERRPSFVRTDRLLTILHAFGFETRQNGSHIKFFHTEDVFSGIHNTIVQGSEKRDSYYTVAKACFEAYSRLTASDDSEPLAGVFQQEASVTAIEADFQKWGEEIDLGDGQVVLRGKRWSCVGIKIQNDPEVRAREIPKLRQRERDFDAFVKRTSNEYGFIISNNQETGDYHFYNWVETNTASLKSFDGMSPDPEPEAFVTALRCEIDERRAITKAAIDWLLQETKFFNPPEERMDRERRVFKRYISEVGFHGFYYEHLSTIAIDQASSVFCSLCKALDKKLFQSFFSPSRLGRLGFRVHKLTDGRLKGYHRYFDDIYFEAEIPKTKFPARVLDDTLQDVSLHEMEIIVGEALEHLDEVSRCISPILDAVAKFSARRSELRHAVVQQLGRFDASFPPGMPKLGEPTEMFISTKAKPPKTYTVKVIPLPENHDFQRGKTETPFVFDPMDVQRVLEEHASLLANKNTFSVPFNTGGRGNGRVVNDPDDPFAGMNLSGLNL